MIGLDGEFNTIRLGMTYAKKLNAGDLVFLLDEKERKVFGTAEVVSVETDKLGEICLNHAAKNHTELASTDGHEAERLFKLLQKIYGPHIATPEKKATVIYLRRTE
jgi:hypothetical protein